MRIKRSDFLAEDFDVTVVQINRHKPLEEEEMEVMEEEREEIDEKEEEDKEQEQEESETLPKDPEVKMRKINELLNMIESQVKILKFQIFQYAIILPVLGFLYSNSGLAVFLILSVFGSHFSIN